MGKQGVSKGLRERGGGRVYTLRLIHYGSPAWLIASVRAAIVYIHGAWCMQWSHDCPSTLHIHAHNTHTHTHTKHVLLYSVQQQQLQLCIRWIHQLFRSISNRAQCRRLIRWVLIPFCFVARKRAGKWLPKTRDAGFLAKTFHRCSKTPFKVYFFFFFISKLHWSYKKTWFVVNSKYNYKFDAWRCVYIFRKCIQLIPLFTIMTIYYYIYIYTWNWFCYACFITLVVELSRAFVFNERSTFVYNRIWHWLFGTYDAMLPGTIYNFRKFVSCSEVWVPQNNSLNCFRQRARANSNEGIITFYAGAACMVRVPLHG